MIAGHRRIVMIQITHVRLTYGQQHEYIAAVRWTHPSTREVGEATRAAMVDYINGGSKAYVTDGRNTAYVGVVDAVPPYIRTYADGKWTDNLLALPRF
jgi:hypothetical protein